MNLDRFNFRWFDKKLGFMAQVKYLNIDDDYALVRYSYADEYTPDEEIKISDGILMQSTGLKDKNGKLIYEGDIINQVCGDDYNDSDYDLMYVDFRDGQFCFMINPGTDHEEPCSMFFEWGQEWDPNGTKIIGNIYEHKHLLDK